MRIGGIASGMDTEQMIKDLMRAERMRIDRFFQQEQRVTWRQEAYNNINKKMANFILDTRKAFGLSRVSSTGSIQSGSVNSFDWVKQANSSHENIVKSSASANAMSGTHKVKVQQLAEVASLSTVGLKGVDADGVVDDSGIVDGSGNIIKSGSFTIEVADGRIKEFKIGVDEISTMNNLVREINNATDSNGKSLGLRAAYDSSLGQMMITTRESGNQQKIKIASGDIGIGGDMFEVQNADTDKVIDPFNGVIGKSAEIEFNGSTVSKQTNNFSIYGINLQLQSAAINTEVTINVNTDVDGIFNKISDFVNSYNELIDTMNGATGEKYYRDFPPLTNEQKEAMNEKDIEKWEEKARSGLLKGDEVLTRTAQTMRTSLYQSVYSDVASDTKLSGFSHITEVGITTGNYQSGGRLEINEDKLRRAINENPEAVMDLFFKTPATTLSTDATAEQKREHQANTGLVQRLYDDMIGGMKEVIRRSGPGEDSALYRNVRSNMLIDFVTSHSSISRLDRELTTLNQRIAREEQLLAGKEDRYWRQFTAMEKAMSQMNQQSDWLMAQMYSGQ